MTLEHRQILHLYNSVIRGITNYYKFASNYSQMAGRVFHIMRQSCAKLLAAKYSLKSISKVYAKFGHSLGTTHVGKDGKEKVYGLLKPSFRSTYSFLVGTSPDIASFYGSKSLASLDNLSCVVCGSNYRVEMHHVRKLSDLNPKLDLVDKLMASRRRKQISLCRKCHMEKHHGPNPNLKQYG